VQSERQILSVLFFNHAVEAAGGRALPCIVNVRQEEQIISAVEKAVKTFGGMLRGRGEATKQIIQRRGKNSLTCFTPVVFISLLM